MIRFLISALIGTMLLADASPGQDGTRRSIIKVDTSRLKPLSELGAGEYRGYQGGLLSSRTYAGYARIPLNPEPYAYESGFAVKWLTEEQMKGDPALNYDSARGAIKAPWLSWGPYLWANGLTSRADDLFYEESDFASDGTHPSASGRRKVADQLLRFFKTDPTTKPWFLR
jgi:hypothetical protein